ncbi:Chitin-binding lectin 1 [Capsicum chinense]|nr:Chitin-binding lectin 1 [Capsicum chinense]
MLEHKTASNKSFHPHLPYYNKMMRTRETAISLLILALFLLNVSAYLSLPFHLPTNNETFGLESYPQGRCGRQAGGTKCPTGACCSISGWCGTTPEYCTPRLCQSQCVFPPPPSYPEGRCGEQISFKRSCPTGQCCSIAGWCGSTGAYCNPGWCQSQCKTITSPTKNRMRGIESFLLNAL